MNPRKPKNVKLLQGTFRKDRNPTNEPEPTLAFSIKSPPSHLGRYGKAYWREVVEELVSCGVITELDWKLLEITCDYYDHYRSARDAIFKYENEWGDKKKRNLGEYLHGRSAQTQTEYSAMNRAAEMFMKYASQIGIGAVARNRIDLNNKLKEEMSDTEKILQEVNG